MRFTWVELVIILAIVLLVFGAGKLPSIARDLGRSITEFKKASKGDETDAEKEGTKKAEVKPAETSESKDKEKAKETRYINLN